MTKAVFSLFTLVLTAPLFASSSHQLAPLSVSVSPGNLAFKVQLIGQTSSAEKVRLTNNGPDTLMINQIYLAGPNPGDFAETNNCGSSLAAGASCKIFVTFTPLDKNTREATLTISDSDPSSPQTIFVSGVGTVVSLSPKKLAFGDQPVGTVSAPQTITLTNLGNTQLNFLFLRIAGRDAGDFKKTNTCGTSIAAGASCTITVTFNPITQGVRRAVVSVGDDGGGSPQKVPLTGTGT